MRIGTVGIIGYGSFGALAYTLLRRFAPAIEARVYSKRHVPDGKKFFSLENVADSDAVVFAVPIHSYEEVLKKVLPRMRKDAVIVDVATVKMHTVNILKRLAGKRPYIATHPMWGPESYKKRAGDVSGFRIVIAAHTLPKSDYTVLTAFLKQCGFNVVPMSPETHDVHLAETLFLTHFIGQIIARAGFERTVIDTVSFGHLMDAVESVENDGELFRDVLRYNPFCKEILDRFNVAERAVRSLIEVGAKGKKTAERVIGISGAKGSFSEEAARTYARKNKLKKFSLEHLISVENVLSALESGSIDLGIFPIENSTGGVVTEALEAMAKHNFKIKNMFEIEIRQNLLVRKSATRAKIRTITSHEQAILQCGAYLKREWKKVKVKEYEDTAKAAEDLANGKLPASCAVIASRAAAKIYKLKILDESIQDLKSNFTSFIVAKRR